MFTLADILEGTGGQVNASVLDATPLRGVTIDSRRVPPGSLFIALRGERVDGHDYVAAAAEQGARAALVSRTWKAPPDLPAGFVPIVVDDPLAALHRFAAWWRARHNVQVVGITGSIGKTTTKEVVASVLSRHFETLKSEGNLNNEIGLPITLLRLTEEHQKAVLEMGAGYALGELTQLCEIAQPEIAAVTMVQPVHLERMGTLERIAQNKSELVRFLPAKGTAVLNGDDPYVRAMGDATKAQILFYGLSRPDASRQGGGAASHDSHTGNDIYATHVESRGLEGVTFRLHFGPSDESWPVKLPLLGAHSVYNAMAAAGVAHAAGMPWDSIVDALQLVEIKGRLRVLPGYNGSTLIDDSYNAAPASTIAALNLLAELAGRRIAVLGDMRELGSHEQEGHIEVGRYAAKVADYLVAVGDLGRIIGEEALRSGLLPDRVSFARNNGAAIDLLKALLQSHDQVLIKGSRGLQMEEIVQGLQIKA